MHARTTTMSPATSAAGIAAAAPRRVGRRFAALIGTAAATVALTLGAASPALAHDELVGYDAGEDSITLTFNNDVLAVGTEFAVTAPDGSDATDGDPEVSGRDASQQVKLDAGDGDYAVVWRVVSSDGHPIQGELGFIVVNGEIDAVTEPDPRTDEDHEHGDDAADEAEHEHGDDADHSHADAGDGAKPSNGASPAVITAISVGGAVVVIGAAIAVIVGQRRRAQGMSGSDSGTGSGPEGPAAE